MASGWVLFLLGLLSPLAAHAQATQPGPAIAGPGVHADAPAALPICLHISYSVRMGTEAEADAALVTKRKTVIAALAGAGITESAIHVDPRQSGFIGPFPSESLLDDGRRAVNGFVDLAERMDVELPAAERVDAVRDLLIGAVRGMRRQDVTIGSGQPCTSRGGA